MYKTMLRLLEKAAASSVAEIAKATRGKYLKSLLERVQRGRPISVSQRQTVNQANKANKAGGLQEWLGGSRVAPAAEAAAPVAAPAMSEARRAGRRGGLGYESYGITVE